MKSKNLTTSLSALALGCVLIAVGLGAEHGWPHGVMVLGIETAILGATLALFVYLGGGR